MIGEAQQKLSRTGWWLITGIYRSRVVYRSSMHVFWGQREIIWSEDVLVTRKGACCPEAISHYLTCYNSLVCISKYFANLVDSNNSPWVWMEPFFNFFAVECFQGPHQSFIQELHFVTALRWEANDVSTILSSFCCRLCVFDEMKKPLGKKSCSVSTLRDGKHELIQAVCHFSVLVSYLFLETQVMEELSVQLYSCMWQLSQENSVQIEKKISDIFQA
jgi:hypothetical protein